MNGVLPRYTCPDEDFPGRDLPLRPPSRKRTRSLRGRGSVHRRGHGEVSLTLVFLYAGVQKVFVRSLVCRQDTNDVEQFFPVSQVTCN